MPTFQEINQAFAQLLTKTVGYPHGTYPYQQEDDSGHLWEYVSSITTKAAAHILRLHRGEDGIGDSDTTPLPRDKEYVIYGGDRTNIEAIYQSDGRYYVIGASGSRYYHRLLRDYRNVSPSDTRKEVYTTLRQLYGDVPMTAPLVAQVCNEGSDV